MNNALDRFKAGLRAYDANGTFSDEDYEALQALLASALRRGSGVDKDEVEPS